MRHTHSKQRCIMPSSRLGDRYGPTGEGFSLRFGTSRSQHARRLAKELHQKAGVPEDLCGLPEVAKFQDVIDEYQIVVLSGEHFNAIVFEGPKRDKQIMSMELEAAEIKFRDSLNFLPMPLKALPKTFGPTELKKAYFPHFFNRKYVAIRWSSPTY